MLTRNLDDLLDLSKYKPEPEDGAVVGWPQRKKPKNKEMEFKVTVQALKSKPAPSASESATHSAERDEL